MIDIKQIRENPEKFRAACEAKGFDVEIDKLLAIDAELRIVKQQLQEISTDKNRIGKSIPRLPPDEKESALSQLSELKRRETEYSEDLGSLQPQFDELMQQVAQPADDDVPVGKDDTENVEIRKEGEIRPFDFEPKDHVQLGLALGIIDIERGVKLAGTRNYFLKGDGALLHWAILRFAMDTMIGKGYIPLSVPLLMKDEAMLGRSDLPDGKGPAQPSGDRRGALDGVSHGRDPGRG